MRRLLARTGLLTVLAGVPTLLYALDAPPRLPSFELPDGLSSTYLPLDPVLQVIALLAWAVWAYLALATMLRAVALWTETRGFPGGRGLAVASQILIPAPFRALLDIAIGGVIIAATLAPRAHQAEPIARAATVSVPAHQVEGDELPKQANTYRVQPGDSMWRIAERELGSGFRWREIFERNRGRTFADGRRLVNPRLIYPGWILELPEQLRAHAQPPGPAERTHEPSVAPSPEQVTDHPERDVRPSDVARPHEPNMPDPVLRLPSGTAIATSFACGLLTAELLGRLRRRRSRRPLTEPLAQAEISEPAIVRELRHAGATPTASPLDVALEQTCTVWREARGALPRLLFAVEERNTIRLYLDEVSSMLPAESGGGVSPRVRFADWEDRVSAEVGRPFPPRLRRLSTPLEQALTVPLAADRKGRTLHAALLGLHGMSVDGEEAVPFVETLLLSLGATAAPDDLQIFTFGDELRVELPSSQSADWEAATTVLRDIEVELLRRARILADEEVDDIWTHLASHSDERFPALVMIAAEPPAALRGVIEGIGRQAARLGGVLIALGWRADGTGLSVQAGKQIEVEFDGTLPLEGRLMPLVLDAQSKTQVAQIVRQATEAETVEEYASAVAEEAPIGPAPHRGPGPLHLAPVKTPTPPPDLPAIHCLGPLRITRGGEVLGDGWRKKAVELVAYLAAHPEGGAKDRIMEDIWPDLDLAKQTRIFEVCASAVRTHVRTDNTERFVERVGESFRLEPGVWWIDATEFARLVTEGLQAPEPDTALQALRSAITLYRADFCDDTYYSWAEPIRERFRDLFVRACAKLGEMLLEAGESEEALSVLERASEADPLCEDIWRRVMLVEVDLGRGAAALHRYRRLTATLAAELQVDPDPETQRLADRISAAQRRRAGSALVSG